MGRGLGFRKHLTAGPSLSDMEMFHQLTKMFAAQYWLSVSDIISGARLIQQRLKSKHDRAL
jgi:hypothetical protein